MTGGTHMAKNKKKTYSSKILSVQEAVEENKNIITRAISGSNIKRLNNINWLRHEIAWNEPQILFWMPKSKQALYFDYSCTKGLGDAYDYITSKDHNEITPSGIRDIHYLVANETNISAGVYRQNPKILEITVNGARVHAPDYTLVGQLVENAIYEWKKSSKPSPLRAFDLHYNLIMIQPFEDYNKRTSRMVMNWALIQCGYRPIVFNRKTDKENYCKALSSMANGDSKTYYKYMYNAMLASQNNIIKQLRTSKIR